MEVSSNRGRRRRRERGERPQRPASSSTTTKTTPTLNYGSPRPRLVENEAMRGRRPSRIEREEKRKQS